MKHLRLTCNIDFDKIEKFVEDLSAKYLICREEGHYHVAFSPIKSKKEIRTMINEILELHGNKDFSFVEARNEAKLLQYICKEGNVRYKGYNFLEIEAFKKLSYKKNLMGEAVQNLEKEYVMGMLSDEDFGMRYINLLVDYDRNLHGNQIKAYLLKMKVKKDPNSSLDIYRNLMRFI